MENLNDGYTMDIPYDANFFNELTPLYLRTLLLFQGLDLPQRPAKTPFRYLELGYGQGTSFAIHASSNEGEFWGTDINPDHVLKASRLIQKPDAHILADSFDELATKSRMGLLPLFDVIVLHGVWSWVSEENRQHILEIISSSLCAGGIVYVSYNCLPGCSGTAPIREFFNFHATHYNYAANTSISKAQDAFALLKTLKDGKAAYFTENPIADAHFAHMQNKSINYIVHEYLNAEWHTHYFKDVAHQLHNAKCHFLCSARPLTQLPVAIPESMRAVMARAHDVLLRESIRDFIHNTRFRCDIYAKGTNKLDDTRLIERISDLHFTLLCLPEHFDYSITCPLGKVACKKDMYAPIIMYLAQDNFAPKSVASILKQPTCAQTSLPHLIEALTVLLGAGIIHPTQKVTKQLQDRCKALNALFCASFLEDIQPNALASPLTGGGIHISPFEKAFLRLYADGITQAEECARALLANYKDAGHGLVLGGKTLDDGEAITHLHAAAIAFEQRLPLLHALGVTLS